MEKDKTSKNKKKITFVLVAIVLILAGLNFWSFFVYFPKQQAMLRQQKSGKNDLLNPSRNFLGSKDLIINFQPLRDYLDNAYETDPNVSIYFEFLNTGANISINKDAEFFPASLLKLPVAMAVAKKIEKGEWKWTNELVLMRNDEDELFGTLYKEPIGTQIAIEELVEKMLVESDNTAYRILLRNLDPKELNDVHDHLGLQQFFSADGKISAKRYSVIFRSLYNGSYLSEENSQKILLLLSETSFKEYLGSALPESVRFSHKIGVSDEHHVFMDAGLVYVPSRPYFLAVMIQMNDQEQAEKIMKDVSGKVYDYISRYDGDGS